MGLPVPSFVVGPMAIDSWTVLGRLPVALVLSALALWVARRAGWRRAALAVSGTVAGVALGVAMLPSILGALAGGIVGGAATLRIVRAPLPGPLKIVTALLAMVAVGRIGCLLNGCCFGVTTQVPWAVSYGPGSMAALFHAGLGHVQAGAASAPVHPLPLYEAAGIALLLGGAALLRRRLGSEAVAALLVAAGYLALCAVLDPWRAMLNTGWSLVRAGPLSAFQWASFAAAGACAVAALALAWRTDRRSREVTGRANPADAERGRPGCDEPPPFALLFAWAVQAIVANLSLFRSTPLVVALSAITLAASAVLLTPRLLLDASGAPLRRRLALALLPLLLAPAGLRAAGGGELAGRRWIYAAALMEEPPQDDSGATDQAPARLVRIGDESTGEETLAARAEELRPYRRSTISGFGGGGSFTFSATDSCSGQTSYYDRRGWRAGASFEHASGVVGTESGVERGTVWQVRGTVAQLEWADRSAGTVSASGRGMRLTGGGLYQWDWPVVSLGLGGLIGIDQARGALGTWLTEGTVGFYPGLYFRLGGRAAGVEVGTLALHDPSERPFSVIYLGAPDLRLRAGVAFQYPNKPFKTAAFDGDVSFLVAPTRWGIHMTAGDGFSGTLRVGIDLP